ncbi:hypothetical protein ACWEOZ_39275 [Actinoplanes sp. NPDC004185]
MTAPTGGPGPESGFDNIAAGAAGATIRRLIARLRAMPDREPGTAAPRGSSG